MIQIKNVSKSYKNGVHALKNINLTIDDGEFVYIIGPTGSGKSTLIKLLDGEEIPDEGKVIVNDVDVGALKHSKVPYYRRNIGVVFQNFRLLPSLTIFENIAFALEVIGMEKQEIRKRVREVLDLVSLSDKAQAFPSQLSGGQQQRVAIGRAIANHPKVLIADEPTTALDVTIQAQILQLLKQLNENEQMNIILITHDLGVVASLAKRIEVMYGGLIMEEGTTEEIFEHPTHPYTRALLHAIPKCESGCRERLEPIPGMAPSLANPPAGCPFVTRCRFACEECKKGIPSMRAYSDTQSSRCIFTKEELDEKEKKEEEK